MKRKIIVASLLILAGLASLYLRPVEEFTRSGSAMNTVIRMTIHARDDSPLDDAYNLLHELDASLSMYNPSSDISRINSLAGKAPFTPGSPFTIEAVNDAMRLYTLTGGIFNPLIGAVTRLWKINRQDNARPSTESLDIAAKLTDTKNITINGGTIYLESEGCILDLGGIAKGYASFKIAELLKNEGVKSAIIDLGGNIYAVGSKPDGSNWRIGVRNPLKPYGIPMLVVDVHDCAVVTSGNYERFKTVDGKKYSHFFDPRTGESVMSDLLSVTVITPDGSLADGLATAFMISGIDEALKILRGMNDAPGVVFITQEGITATSNLRDIITSSEGQITFAEVP